MKPDQLRATAREVAIAAEIAVDLPGEGKGAKHGRKKAGTQPSSKAGICNQGATIGDDAFAEQPEAISMQPSKNCRWIQVRWRCT